MATYHDLDGATTLITGGANGIGEAMVRAFRNQGSTVFFCDFDEDAGKALAKDSGARFTRVDLRSEAEIVDWVGAAAKDCGEIHVLVNNAARDPRTKLEEQSVADWDDLMATNLRPHMLTAREAVPHMPEGASIVNFSSIVFELGMQPMAAYVATKSAIQGLTRSLGRELGPKRIRVNAISPGWIMTERQKREFATDEAVQRLQGDLQSIPDLLQPADIAEVTLFLASRVSNAITGQEIVADHGWVHS